LPAFIEGHWPGQLNWLSVYASVMNGGVLSQKKKKPIEQSLSNQFIQISLRHELKPSAFHRP